jgi:hypothetical protein
MEPIRSLRQLKQEMSILILFFQRIFIYEWNLARGLQYVNHGGSGILSFLVATCAR